MSMRAEEIHRVTWESTRECVIMIVLSLAVARMGLRQEIQFEMIGDRWGADTQSAFRAWLAVGLRL
jgi:hypothetical protein